MALSHDKIGSLNFWCGATIALGACTLYQDWYGLEGYIELCRARWIDALYSVPIAIICIVIALSVRIAIGSIATRLDRAGVRSDTR